MTHDLLPILARVTPALLLLVLAPSMAQGTPVDAESRLSVLETVSVSEYHGGKERGLRLTFKSIELNPALAFFSQEDARAVVVAMENAFKAGRPRPAALSMASLSMGMMTSGGLLMPPARGAPSEMEKQVREAYETIYGAPSKPLPTSLENARWLRALSLSPRYMAEGVREAAVELFNSPAVLLSVGMSLMLYMTAWAVPEPLFSKAFAAAITVALLLTYTAAELYSVGQACLNLYHEAEAATTVEQLEAAAERFGKAIGGVGLRVLVTVAGAKLAKGLPEVPRGGLWARLSPPRFAFAGGSGRGGFSLGAGTRAQVSVADGTVVLMGVSANTAAYAAASAVASGRRVGDCAESKQNDNHGHHICTNKNDISGNSGGPWTPRFEDLFARAGMNLDDPANIVYLRAHKGPHPEEYHREVFKRLENALGSCRTQAECRVKLMEELDKIAGEICTPGSRLNRLATRKP